MARLRTLGKLLLALTLCTVTLLMGVTLLTIIDSLALTGRFNSWLLIGILDDPSSGVLVGAVGSFVVTVILVFASTLMQRAVRREGAWGHALICAAIPILLLLIPAHGMEQRVVQLSIPGFFTGLCWWFAWRRQRVTPGKQNPPRALWAALLMAAAVIGYSTVSAIRVLLSEERQLASRKQRAWIVDGVLTGTNALLLNGGGRLTAYDRAHWRPTVIRAAGVIDIGRAGGRTWILSSDPAHADKRDPSDGPGQFEVNELTHGRLRSLPAVNFEAGNVPLALAFQNGQPIVIGRRALFAFSNRSVTWRRIDLSRPLTDQPPAIPSTLIMGSQLFLGFNVGEFGGGLAAVDLRTGRVGQPQHVVGDLCDGLLNPECDPITGLVRDPADPGCILASIGLSHFLMSGRILRICGSRIEVAFRRSIEAPTGLLERKLRELRTGEVDRPRNEEAFFGMVTTSRQVVWAVGEYGLYRLEGGRWVRQSRPTLQPRGALAIADAVPDLLLLSTDTNAAVSLSGSTPMLVADGDN